MKQILQVANYLHSFGICHRDFKWENVLIIDEDFNVKVIDFGLSKNMSVFEMSTKCGTEYYAAPEIYKG